MDGFLDGGGQEMYEKLWTDEQYNRKSLWCGNERNFLKYVHDEDSCYAEDIEPFTSWQNPVECSNINWDDWMPESGITMLSDDDKVSAAQPLAVGMMALSVVLRYLLGF